LLHVEVLKPDSDDPIIIYEIIIGSVDKTPASDDDYIRAAKQNATIDKLVPEIELDKLRYRVLLV